MIKSILVLFIFLITKLSYADSYVYFGKYLDSTLLASPGVVNDFAQARAGIHIEDKPLSDISQLKLFAENEVLMDGISGTSFQPSQSEFKLGVEIDFGKIKMIIQHECIHPFEMRSSINEEYNLLEIRYKLHTYN